MNNTQLDLENDFKDLLDKELDESAYQNFLEENTALIPVKPYELNHGVNLDLVISKMRIGDSYISDFFYLSKSSDTWNVVFIEIEKPSSKLFNRDGSIAQDLNKGISQINDWRCFFEKDSNKNAFLDNVVIKALRNINPSILENPCVFKYILVIGRREEIYKNPIYKTKLKQLENSDLSIISFDSLSENIERKLSYYLGKIKDSNLFIKNEEYISSQLFQFLPPSLYKIKSPLLKALKPYILTEESGAPFYNLAKDNPNISVNNYIHPIKFDNIQIF